MREFLGFRSGQRPAPGQPIDRDLACSGCGYNLRGLRYGSRCPECGRVVEAPGAAPAAVCDELLAGPYAERRRWRAALAVACACLVAAVAARLAVFVTGFTGLADELQLGYVAFDVALGVLWAGAAWAMTPSRLGGAQRRLRHVRALVRASQLLWPVACVIWLVALARGNDELYLLARLLRLLAGAGAIVLAWQLSWLAERAEREIAARRLNAVVWLLPPATLVPQVFPELIPWYFLFTLGIFLLLWAWVMLLFAAGVLELHRHVRWAMAHVSQEPTRGQRVAETRRALERQVQASMRPLPALPPDIPLAPPGDAEGG